MTFHSYSPNCPFKSIADIAGKKITIMGLGLNGGGEAAARFFLNKGAFVTVTDMKTAEQLAPTLERLNSDKTLDHSRLTYHLGAHDLADFENADCVIKNPGVKYEGNKYLAAAKAIETDLSIFLRFTDCPIIAVTGSKGKSSTGSFDFFGLVGVAFVRVPAVRFKTLALVGRGRNGGRTVDRDLVVVPQNDHLVQTQMAGEGNRFLGNAFHQATVAADHIGVVVDDFFTETGGQQLFGDCHTDGGGNALTQRPRGRFNAFQMAVFGVTGTTGTELAEVF